MGIQSDTTSAQVEALCPLKHKMKICVVVLLTLFVHLAQGTDYVEVISEEELEAPFEDYTEELEDTEISSRDGSGANPNICCVRCCVAACMNNTETCADVCAACCEGGTPQGVVHQGDKPAVDKPKDGDSKSKGCRFGKRLIPVGKVLVHKTKQRCRKLTCTYRGWKKPFQKC